MQSIAKFAACVSTLLLVSGLSALLAADIIELPAAKAQLTGCELLQPAVTRGCKYQRMAKR